MTLHLKTCLCCLLCMATVAVAFGQKVSFSFGVNYGTFNMSDPKSFQDQVVAEMPAHSKKVSDFPGFTGYDAQLYYQASLRFSLGMFYGLSSTGGRVSYADFSGSYNTDEFTKGHQLGLGGEFLLSADPAKSFRVYFSGRVGWIFTTYKVDSKLTLGSGPVAAQVINFKATSLLVSPGLVFTKDITSAIFLKAEARYVVDTGGELKDPHGINLVIQGSATNPGGRKVYTDWSGIRVGVMVGLKFGKPL